jgi:integrase
LSLLGRLVVLQLPAYQFGQALFFLANLQQILDATSEMLGHADISITLRIYAHVIPDMQQEAANMMDGMLGQ